MKKNMGNTDCNIRLTIAVVIAVLFLTHFISGTSAYILLVVAGLFTLTSVVRYCPGYTLFKINTRPKKTT
jgi:hypothetical protein